MSLDCFIASNVVAAKLKLSGAEGTFGTMSPLIIPFESFFTKHSCAQSRAAQLIVF